MSSAKICLERNDFDTASSKMFVDLYQNPEFSDITLVTEDDQLLHAHKIIISSGSQLIKQMITSSKQKHILNLKASFSDLSLFLQFMYTGQCEVEQNNLVGFLAAAKLFQIDGLSPNIKEESKESVNFTSNKSIKSDDKKTHHRVQDVVEDVTESVVDYNEPCYTSFEHALKEPSKIMIEQDVLVERKEEFVDPHHADITPFHLMTVDTLT